MNRREQWDAVDRQKLCNRVEELQTMNKRREQWAKVDPEHCAVQNSVAANLFLIRDAQQDIESLYRQVDELNRQLEELIDDGR